MFPMIAQASEFDEARALVLEQVERHRRAGHPAPDSLPIGAMLETPSLAFAPDAFFAQADFISIGGNDLKQFFFAADRENERVRRRYEMVLERRSGRAVVEVVGGACSGCHMQIPPQMVIEILSSGAIRVCPSCQRILYARE